VHDHFPTCLESGAMTRPLMAICAAAKHLTCFRLCSTTCSVMSVSCQPT
jgi:hypothetical protein